MKGVIRNARKGGPNPNNSLPKGAARIAASGDDRALLEAALYGNRATRRLGYGCSTPASIANLEGEIARHEARLRALLEGGTENE
jgi:hypothetical protein